jgi:hypothetical protein
MSAQEYGEDHGPGRQGPQIQAGSSLAGQGTPITVASARWCCSQDQAHAAEQNR